MTVQVALFDDSNGAIACISENGEVIVRDFDYSDSYYASAAVADTPYEIVPGKAGFRFITKAFWIAATKTVSPTAEATVVVYEAAPDDLSINLATKINLDLLRGERFPSPSGLNMKTSDTRTLVVTTTDATVNVTIVGYYVPTANGEDE